MSNLERDRLLSDLEFERLKNRSQEPHTRATNDGRVRRKLSAWLKNIDDGFFEGVGLAPDFIPSEMNF